MALATVTIASLAFLAAIAALGRLHLLSLSLSSLRDAVLAAGQGEVNHLRKQVETLQQQVLALTDPGAQARLHVQALPVEQQAERKPRREPALVSGRNPQQIDIHPRLSDPMAFEVLGIE